MTRLLQGASRVAIAAIGISTIALAATRAGAQQAPSSSQRDTSSLPFHDDQWGLDFGISGNHTYRVGAVRFTSPTRAWILDGRISGSLSRTERWADPDTGIVPIDEDRISQGGSVSLLVGRRAYRGMGARAMRTVSFGVGGGAGYSEYLSDGRRINRSMSWNATSEFAVGAHYRVTPSLALGGTLRLGATYSVSDTRGEQYGYRERGQHLNVGLGTSDLVLSLFF